MRGKRRGGGGEGRGWREHGGRGDPSLARSKAQSAGKCLSLVHFCVSNARETRQLKAPPLQVQLSIDFENVFLPSKPLPPIKLTRMVAWLSRTPINAQLSKLPKLPFNNTGSIPTLLTKHC
jgi:hypothetical protein